MSFTSWSLDIPLRRYLMYLDPKNISKTYPKHLLKMHFWCQGNNFTHPFFIFPYQNMQNLCPSFAPKSLVGEIPGLSRQLMALPYDDFRHKLLKDRSLSVLLAFLLVGWWDGSKEELGGLEGYVITDMLYVVCECMFVPCLSDCVQSNGSYARITFVFFIIYLQVHINYS